MALQTSGAISLSDIQTEFGGINPVSLSEYYGVDTPVPASGAIALSDFYGTSAVPPYSATWSGGQLYYISGSYKYGYEVSGSLFRAKVGTGTEATWRTAYTDGTFQAVSYSTGAYLLCSGDNTSLDPYSTANSFGIFSGSYGTTYGNMVYFDPAQGGFYDDHWWTGGYQELQWSGYTVRYHNQSDGQYSDWVTLS